MGCLLYAWFTHGAAHQVGSQCSVRRLTFPASLLARSVVVSSTWSVVRRDAGSDTPRMKHGDCVTTRTAPWVGHTGPGDQWPPPCSPPISRCLIQWAHTLLSTIHARLDGLPYTGQYHSEVRGGQLFHDDMETFPVHLYISLILLTMTLFSMDPVCAMDAYTMEAFISSFQPMWHNDLHLCDVIW